MTAATMRERGLEPGAGERAERARRTRRRAVIAALFAVGFGAGAYMGRRDASLEKLVGDAPLLSPAAAVALILVYAAALIVGGWLLARNADELHTFNRYRSAASGSTAMMLVYPPWFFLWKAGLVAEPSHIVLFLILLASMIAAEIYLRFR